MSVAKGAAMMEANTSTTAGTQSQVATFCARSRSPSVVLRLRKLAPCRVKSKTVVTPANRA